MRARSCAAPPEMRDRSVPETGVRWWGKGYTCCISRACLAIFGRRMQEMSCFVFGHSRGFLRSHCLLFSGTVLLIFGHTSLNFRTQHCFVRSHGLLFSGTHLFLFSGTPLFFSGHTPFFFRSQDWAPRSGTLPVSKNQGPMNSVLLFRHSQSGPGPRLPVVETVLRVGPQTGRRLHA